MALPAKRVPQSVAHLDVEDYHRGAHSPRR